VDLELKGKRCVVLGASRGIGRAIAQGLAREGGQLSLCARQAGTLEAFAEELRTTGGTVHAAACDIGDPAALGAYLDAARLALGGIDVLVANASALSGGEWEPAVRVDLMATVRACEQVAPWMAEAGGGSILLVSSIAGLDAFPMNDVAYTTVKAALIAYAKKLSMLLAPQRIRVNAIAPGSIDFPEGFWDRVREKNPTLYEAVRDAIPWGRYGTPEEVADVACYLVSARAGWVTGECVAVDGGQHRAMR